ncbi:MAG: L-threonylcarbamoyladenylate synthase [Gammaproteobacteria bacterium]|nr:L-threonylcarbamoyladenylate synthase [Gammaproteobacteria bacterium]
MAQFFVIHPENPQARLVNQAVAIIRGGGLVVYPTDSGYALGCHIGDKAAQERIRRIRRLDDKHNFTLVCRDLSEIATYARVDNADYRAMRNSTPGPYTFILRATGEVPRRLQNPKRKTIGIRIPDNGITMALLDALGEPLMSSTLIPPDSALPMTDPDVIREEMGAHVDVIIDGGFCGLEPTTVVDLTQDVPQVVRTGRGDPEPFL